MHQIKFSDPIVTEVVELTEFYPAEEYHQDYWTKNPDDGFCQASIPKKIEKISTLDEFKKDTRDKIIKDTNDEL